MKTWLKSGLIGGIIGFIFPWINYLLYGLLPKHPLWKFFLHITGIVGFGNMGRFKISIILTIVLFLIGAIIGLIIQKLRK